MDKNKKDDPKDKGIYLDGAITPIRIDDLIDDNWVGDDE